MICPKVVIVIVNWNGWEDTIECLESLFEIDYENFDIIIVDNHSQDKATERIHDFALKKFGGKTDFFNKEDQKLVVKEFVEKEAEGSEEDEEEKSQSVQKFTIIQNDKNYGFGKANNIGFEYALRISNPSYFLLLNNDTVVDQGFLKHLVIFMENNHDVGICNPLQYQYEHREIVLAAGGSLNLHSLRSPGSSLNAYGMLHPAFKRPFETTYASGAAMLIRKDALLSAGFFDESMLVGGDDIDISLRFWIRGWRVMVNPASMIYHKNQASVKKKPQSWLAYHGTQVWMLWLLKNLQTRGLLISLPFFLVTVFAVTLKDLAVRRDPKLAAARIGAIRWNFINFSCIMEKRCYVQRNRVFSDTRFLKNHDWEMALQN